MFDSPSFIGLPVMPDQSPCRELSMMSWAKLRTLPEKSSSCCMIDQPMVDFLR